MASMMFTMSACADYKQIIQFNELPQAAQDFVTQYYNTTDIMHIETEQDGLTKDYTVYLNNGTQIDFEHNGQNYTITKTNIFVHKHFSFDFIYIDSQFIFHLYTFL